MKCCECGDEYRDVHGCLEWEDYYAGTLTVEDVSFQRCKGCGELLLPPPTLDAIDQARSIKLTQWLENRPLKDFWDSRQVTEFLGLSRQALSKGVQLNNLIYKTQRLGKHCYLADSVRQYKRTGDGRLRLEFRVETDDEKVETLIDNDFDFSSEQVRINCNQSSARPHMVAEKQGVYSYA